MASHPAEPGLRERKRLATRRAIQHAVLTLTRERGIDRVTIDDISRIANVSPRTFFNYFPSKDAALVGDAPSLASVEDIERFVHAGPGGDIFGQVSTLLAESLTRAESDREIHQLRKAVMKDNVYLFGMRMATVREFEDHLQEVIARRFVADSPARADDPVALDQQALLFTLIAVAAIRHAWRCWAEDDGATSLSERVAASFADVYAITHQTD